MAAFSEVMLACLAPRRPYGDGGFNVGLGIMVMIGVLVGGAGVGVGGMGVGVGGIGVSVGGAGVGDGGTGVGLGGTGVGG